MLGVRVPMIWRLLMFDAAFVCVCVHARAYVFMCVCVCVQFEIEGTLINVMKPQSFPSGFVKREFVVRTDEMYPQEVKFELYKV